MKEKKLTIKQENFCEYYATLGNATEAYRRAYDAEGMKEITINGAAYKMLQMDKIKQKVKDLRLEAAKEFKIERGVILKNLVDNMEKAVELEELSEVRQSAQAICKMEGFDKGKDVDAVGEIRVLVEYPR